MSNSFRRVTAKKLQEIINTATDPTIVIEAANALAKFLPKPKQIKRRPGTPVGPIKAKEPSLNELVAMEEKKRREGRSVDQQRLFDESNNTADCFKSSCVRSS